MRRPKIIATLGTTTDERSVLEGMVENGMSCARMNTAYATIPEYQQRLDLLRSVAPVDVMMDIKGPEIRLICDRPYDIRQGDRLIVGFGGEALRFSSDFVADVYAGDRILFENGEIEAFIKAKTGDRLNIEIVNPGQGYLSSHMGVNVPGRYLNVDQLTPKDHEVIEFSIRNEVEYIALSFVRDYNDVRNLVRTIRAYQHRQKSDHMPGIVAKIEDSHGVKNLKDIIDRSKRDDVPLSVMLARGDLYVELPPGDLPFAQEHVIKTCNDSGTFVITATGVLESMQWQYEPSRAEVNDVYNAMVQGTDAFMFSGETSNGHDPVRAVWRLKTLIDAYVKNTGGQLYVDDKQPKPDDRSAAPVSGGRAVKQHLSL